MAPSDLADLQAFVAVAQARNFTRAAAQLGLSRSALSHAMTALEARLAHDHTIKTVLWPKLVPLLREYSDVQVEISVDYGLTDIAAQRFDAGVRNGNLVNKDPLDLMQPHIDAGRLLPVLQEWWPRFPGYHLYYTSRRQMSPAFALILDALRHR